MEYLSESDIVRKTYADNDFYKAELEFIGGHVFVHLSSKKWSATAVRMMRKDLDHMFDIARNQGYEFLFVYNNIGMKFANLIKPLDIEQNLERGFILGAWRL